MPYSSEERAIFNDILSKIEVRKREMVGLYRETQEKILDRIARYNQRIQAGEISAQFSEARLRELYSQVDDEIARLMEQIERVTGQGFIDSYETSYYRTSYITEKWANLEASIGTDITLNYPALPTNAAEAALSERIAGHTFSDRIAHDRAALQFQLRRAVAENVITGESVQKLKKNLELIDDAFKTSRAKAFATARTELLRAYSEGMEVSIFEAETAGVEFQYMWSAALDGRTRPTHRRADGKKAKIVNGEPRFVVGGVWFTSPRVVHPDNPSGNTAKEVVNCRCRRLNLPFGIEPTNRAARLPDGSWTEQPFNMDADTWYEYNYA